MPIPCAASSALPGITPDSPHPNLHRRWLCAAPLSALLLASAGCASFAPRSFTLSEAELTRLLAGHFPLTQRLAEVVDVTVTSPRVWLIPERNRLGGSFDVHALERLFGRAAQGKLAMDCALRLEPADDSIRLTQVRVQQLQMESGGAALPMQAQRIGTLLAERVLDEMAVYRLKPRQAERLHAAGLRAGAITVTAQGVEVALAAR
ncbi:hypothetical protein [Ideonella sp. BN130291]|uniref:hypothetical protein n=1 Tax=Ideonella sp. BN130291 TaxID=3112940 RepID=UPI002E2549E2|nr:hypothetical protein [Ideonella sp. BN130291]